MMVIMLMMKMMMTKEFVFRKRRHSEPYVEEEGLHGRYSNALTQHITEYFTSN
jgi:hypothetical protein